MEKYINIKGKEVVIKDLSDKELVFVYRFFLRHNNIMKKKGAPNNEIKDILKAEINNRKIKISKIV